MFASRRALSSGHGWSRALREAEALVGYSSSMRSYRELASDEITNLALVVRKLIGVQHPLLSTARRLLLSGGEHGIKTRGLLLLLVSKALNSSLSTPPPALPADGVLPSQRVLVEVTEMVLTSFALHHGVMEEAAMDGAQGKEQRLGNKMAVLGGDFLLANASSALAKLEVPAATDLVSRGIEDMSRAGIEDQLPPQRRLELGEGSLCGHSAQAAAHLALAGPPSALLDSLKDLASHSALSLAWAELARDGDEVDRAACRQHCATAVDSALGALGGLRDSQASTSLAQLLGCIREQGI